MFGRSQGPDTLWITTSRCPQAEKRRRNRPAHAGRYPFQLHVPNRGAWFYRRRESRWPGRVETLALVMLATTGAPALIP